MQPIRYPLELKPYFDTRPGFAFIIDFNLKMTNMTNKQKIEENCNSDQK